MCCTSVTQTLVQSWIREMSVIWLRDRSHLSPCHRHAPHSTDCLLHLRVFLCDVILCSAARPTVETGADCNELHRWDCTGKMEGVGSG